MISCLAYSLAKYKACVMPLWMQKKVATFGVIMCTLHNPTDAAFQ